MPPDEAEQTPETPETPEAPEAPEAPERIVLDFGFDTGDLEDIEEYTGLSNVYAMLSDAVEGIPPGRQVQALAGKLSAKMLSAVLGAARRRADPSWTMDRWREFRFTDLRDVKSEDELEADPTNAGSTPGTKRTSKPKQTVAANGSVSTQP